MERVILIRMIPGYEPLISYEQPSLEVIEALLGLDPRGQLLMISHPRTPYLSVTYIMHPNKPDEVAVMTQHMGGILP